MCVEPKDLLKVFINKKNHEKNYKRYIFFKFIYN